MIDRTYGKCRNPFSNQVNSLVVWSIIERDDSEESRNPFSNQVNSLMRDWDIACAEAAEGRNPFSNQVNSLMVVTLNATPV